MQSFENIECEWPLFYTYLDIGRHLHWEQSAGQINALYVQLFYQTYSLSCWMWLTFLSVPIVFEISFDPQVEEYSVALDGLLITTPDGLKLLPKMYAVPHDKVSHILEHHKNTAFGIQVKLVI